MNTAKKLDMYTQIATAVFATDLKQAEIVQIGDYIDIEHTSRFGNKKKQSFKVIEKIMRPKINIVIFITDDAKGEEVSNKLL